MTTFLRSLVLLFFFFAASITLLAQDSLSAKAGSGKHYSLDDFYRYDPELAHRVDEVFAELNDSQRVAQMIVPAIGRYGKEDAHIRKMVQQQAIGGLLLLNGTKAECKAWVQEMDSITKAVGGLPLLYTADAEPSLINRKIKGTRPVPVTSSLQSIPENQRIAELISQELLEIGIRQNYAPVTDVSTSNRAIGNRSYSANADTVQMMNASFIHVSQKMGVAATAKHFPGHGLVTGDSHHRLVYIKDSLMELGNYPPLIEKGVISVMVGHIALEDANGIDTENMPATLSRAVVTDLLKGELGFSGLVVTDALNMKAVSEINKAPVKAIQAGCDQVLMPEMNEAELRDQILVAMYLDKELERQVFISVKKIIRLKLCLGLIAP